MRLTSRPTLIWIRVHTDEGLIGLGESWLAVPPAGMAPFEAIRKAHGDRMSIKAELHGIWGLGAAKAICAALESIRPDWVEDPIWMDRTADIAELTASTRAPSPAVRLWAGSASCAS